MAVMSLKIPVSCLLLLSVALPLVIAVCDESNPHLFPLFRWKTIDFEYESNEAREKDISEKKFVKENVIPVGLEVWNMTMFVTLPRWKSGVPASLAYFDKRMTVDTPKLIPYPNWAAHDLSDNNSERIVSPFRVQADSCQRLWILDTGVDDIVGKFNVISPSQVIVYDLTTNKRLLTYSIPANQTAHETFFANIVVDVLDCENTFAYLADLAGYIVVYDWKNKRSWQIDQESFKLDPEAITFEVNKYRFNFTDGVFGMALTEADPTTKDRTMFYHPFSSFSEFKVKTSVLRDEVKSSDPKNYIRIGEKGPMSQANAAAVDVNTGVFLYTQVNHDAIGCWNYRDNREAIFSPDNQDFLDKNSETLIFPNDIKVTDQGDVWVLSDKMTDFTTRQDQKPNLDDYNFRILHCKVETLVKNKKCAPAGKNKPADSVDSRSRSGAAALVATMLLLPVTLVASRLF